MLFRIDIIRDQSSAGRGDAGLTLIRQGLPGTTPRICSVRGSGLGSGLSKCEPSGSLFLGCAHTTIFSLYESSEEVSPQEWHPQVWAEGGQSGRARRSLLRAAGLAVVALGPAVQGFAIDTEDLCGVNLVAVRNAHDFFDVAVFEFAEGQPVLCGCICQRGG